MGRSDLEPLGVSELGSPGRRSELGRQGATRVVAFDRFLARRMLGALGDPPFSIDLWNGEQIYTSTAPSVARVEVEDRGALVRLMLDPEMSFGDLYSVGRVDVGFLEDGSVLVTWLEYVGGEVDAEWRVRRSRPERCP